MSFREEWTIAHNPGTSAALIKPVPSVIPRYAFPGFCLLTAALLVSPGARLLVYLFPLLSLGLGSYLYSRDRMRFTRAVCYLWMFTPLVRRVVDYRAGWIPATAILLAPIMALCGPLPWLVADLRRTLRVQPAGLLCVLLAVVYSLSLGILHFPLQFVVQDLLTWLAPLLFAVILLLRPWEAPELFDAFEAAMLYGTIGVSLYGIAQFFFLPQWDVLWMNQVNLGFGEPEVTKVRVFSSMNAPQILASFLVAGLLLAFNSRRPIRVLTIPLNLLCLLISLARSGWFALLGGSLYLIIYLPRRQKLHFVVAGVFAAVLMTAAFQNHDLEKVISKRFDSLSNGRNDLSLVDRLDGYRAVLLGFSKNPFGLGMGATPAIAGGGGDISDFTRGGQSLALGDSSVLAVLITMGIPGSVVFFGSALKLIGEAFSPNGRHPACIHSARALLVAWLTESLLDGVVSGPTGFLTWATVGFCIALQSPDMLRAGIRNLSPLRAPSSPWLRSPAATKLLAKGKV